VVFTRSDGQGGIETISSFLASPEDVARAAPDGQAVLYQINSGWPAHLFYRTLGTGDPEDFQRIGHCWLAPLLGMVGGGLARRFHAGARLPLPPRLDEDRTTG